MKVLSLFDGMACGMLAMLDAGVEVEHYTAYEIDKYAVKAATHNFPMIKECGDVFAADFMQYRGVDFLVGGSPCTYWSIAQTKNRETEASGIGWELFSQYVRALNEAKPRLFIYENNKSMGKAIRDQIRATFGFEEICINSALVSAQNRQRYYWVGRRLANGLYVKVNVQQPEDLGILLRDILETGEAWKPKQNTIDANYYKGGNLTSPGKQSGQRFTEISAGDCVDLAQPNSKTRRGRSMADKSNCLTTGNAFYQYLGVLSSDSSNHPVCVGEVPEHRGLCRNGNECSQQYRVHSADGKAVCVDADKRKWVSLEVPQYAYPTRWSEDGIPTKAISVADGKEYTVYPVQDGRITIKDKTYPIKLIDGYYIIRKLTVRECMRLQTVPEWYDFSCVSNTQAYKMLGNGWTVKVISHLIKACLAEEDER